MPASNVGRDITRRGVSRRDFLTQMATDKNEQRAITKKIFDREHDQVFRMWMPYDGGFLIFQPHPLAMRRTDGYGASTVARIWSEK